MQKWEYLSVSVDVIEGAGFTVLRKNGQALFTEVKSKVDYSKCPTWESFLTSAGEDGWELVGFTGDIYSKGLTIITNHTLLRAVFKRPKE